MTLYRPTQKSAETMSLSCLDGRRLEEVEAPGEPQWPWVFRFEGGSRLTVEGPWRVVGSTRIEIAGDDHLQLFGHSEPVDATRSALGAIAGTRVTSAAFEAITGDLRITFGSGVRLEALTHSCAYESWQLHRPDGVVIVSGGGDVRPGAPDPAG